MTVQVIGQWGIDTQVGGGGPTTAPTPDVTATGGGAALSGSTVDLSSFTLTGVNRGIIVAVGYYDAENNSVSAVAFDPAGVNEAFDFIGRDFIGGGVGLGIELWGRINPTAKAGIVRVTFSATGQYAACCALALTGMAQTTPFGTFVSNTDNSAPLSVSTTAAPATTGYLIVDGAVVGTGSTLAEGADQAVRATDDEIGAFLCKISTQAGTAGGVMSWTSDNAASGNALVMGAVSVKGL